jgi:hypothetical protein
MAKFKEGDRIRMKSSCSNAVEGLEYELVRCSCCSEKLRTNIVNKHGCSCSDYWELVSDNCHKNPMKITNIARGLLDEDYKRMIKVGWLNADLSLTDTGKDTVLSRYLMKNKETFGEMATELLDENKEDCK